MVQAFRANPVCKIILNNMRKRIKRESKTGGKTCMTSKDSKQSLQIFPRPSKLCGNCAQAEKKGEKCTCKCHDQALFAGFHEDCYHLPLAQPVENVTEFSDEPI